MLLLFRGTWTLMLWRGRSQRGLEVCIGCLNWWLAVGSRTLSGCMAWMELESEVGRSRGGCE